MIRHKKTHYNLNNKVKEFINHVKEHLAQYDMELLWGRGFTVHCGGYTSSAYFSEYQGVIKVAKGNHFWLESLVHEYAHFLQWLNNCPVFKKADKAIMNVDKWFSRKKIDQNELKKSFEILRTMERDCEMMACKIAKRFKLPINTNGYIKRANLYIYTHWMMEKHQKFWAFRRDPMNSRYILSLMPSNFRARSHKRIPTKIEKALEGYIYY